MKPTTCRAGILPTFFAITHLLVACNGHVDLGSDRHDDASPSVDSIAIDDGAPVGRDSGFVDTSTADTFLPDTPCVPPTFAGVRFVNGIRDTSAIVSWDAATHPSTPASSMRYSVYVDPTAPDFTKAAVSVEGALGTTISGLSADTSYFVVVRAKSADGCEDGNTVAMEFTTESACSLPVVQAIFDRNCAVSGCHVLPTPPQDMNLSSGFSYGKIVNVESIENAPMFRVTPGDAEQSYLYRKITGRPSAGTSAMPPPGASALPTAEEKDFIRCWINSGAKP